MRRRTREINAQLRTSRATHETNALEVQAHRDRLARDDADEARKLRSLGLSGTMPVKRRSRPDVDLLSNMGLISVSKIFDDVAHAKDLPAAPPRSPRVAADEPPGYLRITKAAHKRATKNVSRREALEARQPDPPTKHQLRVGVPL